MKDSDALQSGISNYSLFLYSFARLTAPKDKVRFIREFFGYRLSKSGRSYSYGGLLQKLKGIKISNSSFLVPNQNAEIIEAYLKSRGVDFVVKK